MTDRCLIKYIGEKDDFWKIAEKVVIALKDPSKHTDNPDLVDLTLEKRSLLVIGTVKGIPIQEIWIVKDIKSFIHPLFESHENQDHET